MPILIRWLLISLLSVSLPVQAESIELPLVLQQAFLQGQLDRQLQPAEEGRFTVWEDGRDCNRLELAQPQLWLSGGRVHTRNRAFAQVGTAVAGRCLSIVRWEGFVEIEQEPSLGVDPGTVQFRVVDSRVYSENGESRGVIGTVWDWVKKYAHPRFERLRVDINPLLAEIGQLMPLVYPDQPAPIRRILEGVTLTDARIEADTLQLILRIDRPSAFITAAPVESQPVLTEAELARWEQSWRQWDAFVTYLIKQVGLDAVRPDLRAELLAVLIEARQDLLPLLTSEELPDVDPLPALFLATWQRLEPVLRAFSAELPADSVLRYAAFISAADALAALQTAGDSVGISLNADVLRRMARLANPAAVGDPLEYRTGVDAELRAIFGFGPPLPRLPPAAVPAPANSRGIVEPRAGGLLGGMMLVGVPALALGDPHYLRLVERLNGWVPRLGDLDEYLPLVQQLLDRTVGATLNSKGLQREYFEIFRPLVLATAWQESCWRQFISRNGEIMPIRSPAGAVGIMQVNQHVWRGFYEIDGLQNNVG